MATSLNVLVVEDEVIVSEEISECLVAMGYNVIGQAASATEAMHLISGAQVDVALLDISIKGELDGIALAEQIRIKHKCAIIFLTAHSDDETLKRASTARPEAYLVKPFEQRSLYASINLAFENYNREPSALASTNERQITDRVFLRDGQKYTKVFISEILFLEAQGSYCKVITASKTFTYSLNLKEAINRIVHPDLVRVHRSFLVNIKNVDSIEGNKLTLSDHTIQIGTTYRDNVISHLNIL